MTRPIPTATTPSALSGFLETAAELARRTQTERVAGHLQAIFESDRWSDFARFEQTAARVRGFMERIGLEDVELEALPADGKTVFGDWIMPLAWDAEAAELWLGTAQNPKTERLACYASLPDSLIMQSAPTPPEGLRAELIADQGASPKCKVVLVEEHPRFAKGRLAAAGALGLVSCWHPNPEDDPTSTYWVNTWSDRPGGWHAHAGDAPLFGFSISPQAGARIRMRLNAGEKLHVFCRVASRFREGAYPFVSGRIRGAGPRAEEELIVCAHLYEHGAHDNASGASCTLETAAVLAEATREGTLPRPARSLRFLLMPECYGTLGYAARRPERIARTVAGINLDGVGAGRPVRVIKEPPQHDAGLGALLLERLRALWGRAAARPGKFELCDNLLADPAIGVPMVWPHAPCARTTWHTSMDDLSAVDYAAIAQMASAVGAFLAELAERPGFAPVAPPPVPVTSKHPDAHRIPRRTRMGPLSLDTVPVEAWPAEIAGSPRWWSWHTQVWWWVDGTRTLGEIAARMDEGKADIERVAAYFRFLERHGNIEPL